MNIPNFINAKIVDKDGNLTDVWRNIFMQLFSQLQGGLSEEGIKVPQQTTTNIAQIESGNTVGNIVYDSSLNVLKINLNGTFKTIQTL